jgi:phosphotransferase system  glucose/maltose/N-acetylglucosamine-specific IIC component
MGLYYFGMGLATAGKYGGTNSLVYGILNRCLVPFGLHHVLNVPMWFTSIGGTFNNAFQPLFNGLPCTVDGVTIDH